MSAGFDSLLEQTKDSFKCLLAKPLIPVKDASRIPLQSAGIYVFYENGKPLRVGTTTDVRKRIRQHHGRSFRSAAFAKRLARCATGIKGGTRPGEGWKTQAGQNSRLDDEFEKAGKRICEMSVRWVEESHADSRYLLEFYAAKKLGTPHNNFRET